MKYIVALMSVMMILALGGCGSKNYQVTTKSGENYTASGPLEYNVQSETYTFKNEDGKEVILNQEDIEVIQEK